MGEEKGICSIVSALSYAVSEWLLMLLLFINGLFSYIITRFAQYCNLQPPCLFCSRLDHILGSKDSDFFKGLICSSHKLEISSWVYCRLHQRLVDVHKICEACLLSFATEKNNLETYMSLVGKVMINLNLDKSCPANFFVKSVTKEKCADELKVPHYCDLALGFLKNSHCSCCNNHFRMKLHTDGQLQSKCVSVDNVEPSGTNSGLTEPVYHSQTPYLQRAVERSPQPHIVSHCESHNFDPLIYSGNDNFEAAASNDGCGQANTMINIGSQSTEIELYSSEAKDSARSSITEKQLCTPPIEDASTVSAQGDQYPAKELSDAVSLVITSSVGHESEEFARYEVHESKPSLRFDIISSQALSDVAKSNGGEVAKVLSATSRITCGVPDALDSDDVISKHLTQNANEPPLTVSGTLDLNDMYKMVISNKGNEASHREPSRPQDDLKLLLSQLSSARGLDSPWNDVTSSPRVYGTSEETKALDDCGSSSLPNITKRFSIERNESGLSSLDGSAFSEIEGESAVNRLKRLVEFKKRSSFLLHKELEEERNASAIAVNQAMAMITRLQEEKAAMQMEALQYQRLMEEQTEYDHEELQKSNDLLSEREKELRDLKEEVAIYKKLLDIHNGNETLSLRADVDDSESSLNKREEGRPFVNKSLHACMGATNFENMKDEPRKDVLLEFEGEIIYISQFLKKLVEKLHLISNEGLYTWRDRNTGMKNELPIKDVIVDENTFKNAELQSCLLNMCPETRKNGDDSFSLKGNFCPARQITNSSFYSYSDNNEDNLSPSLSCNANESEKHFAAVDRGKYLAATITEILELSERLKSLEADQNFI